MTITDWADWVIYRIEPGQAGLFHVESIFDGRSLQEVWDYYAGTYRDQDSDGTIVLVLGKHDVDMRRIEHITTVRYA